MSQSGSSMSSRSASSATPSLSSRGSRSVSTASFKSSRSSRSSSPDPLDIPGVEHYAHFWDPHNEGLPDRVYHQVSDFIGEVTSDPSVRDTDLVLMSAFLRDGAEARAHRDLLRYRKPYDEGMGKTQVVRRLSTVLKEMRKALPHVGSHANNWWAAVSDAADAWMGTPYKYRADKRWNTAFPTPNLSYLLDAVLLKRLEKARPRSAVRRTLHAGAAYAQSQRRAPPMDPVAAAEQAFGRLRLMRNSARSHAMGLEGPEAPRLLKYRKGPGRAPKVPPPRPRTASKRSRPNHRKPARPTKRTRS